MGFWATVWVVLMVLWLVLGCYAGWTTIPPGTPGGPVVHLGPVLGYTLLPWACVAILGYLILGGGGIR